MRWAGAHFATAFALVMVPVVALVKILEAAGQALQ